MPLDDIQLTPQEVQRMIEEDLRQMIEHEANLKRTLLDIKIERENAVKLLPAIREVMQSVEGRVSDLKDDVKALSDRVQHNCDLTSSSFKNIMDHQDTVSAFQKESKEDRVILNRRQRIVVTVLPITSVIALGGLIVLIIHLLHG